MKRSDWDRTAKDYHDEVISPFQKGVSNPLFRKLKNVKAKKGMVVADIGCGRGEILDRLAAEFKDVYAIDFSPQMIKIARQRNKRKNIHYFLRDMRELGEFESKFDVVVSVNSVLFPQLSSINKALSSIHGAIKKGGYFFGVFPSMGSILYQAFLILEEQFSGCKDERKALFNTRKILERKKYDFVKGIYKDGRCRQKFYYNFELKIRLQNAGFKNIRLCKVLYPWREDISDYEIFTGRPRMWDWFVSAKK